MPELAGRIADAFEARIREQEETLLSPLAVRSYETRGRAVEEERRLAYVALTRATRRLVLAFDPARPSRFVGEMGLATGATGPPRAQPR